MIKNYLIDRKENKIELSHNGTMWRAYDLENNGMQERTAILALAGIVALTMQLTGDKYTIRIGSGIADFEI